LTSIRGSIGWANTKDLDLLYSIITNGSIYLEVQPRERIVKGFENFKKAENFWMSPDFKAISYKIKGLRINISQSGEVAWYFCTLDDINEWKGEPASWINTR